MNEPPSSNEITPDTAIDNIAVSELEDAFSYTGYQVVRGEFFAHTFEPSFTLHNNKVSVNTACLRKMPDTDFIQILVNPKEKKLAVKPCNGSEKDSFRWCSNNPQKRNPKQITCRVFFAKVMALMGWNPNYRYRLLGKLLTSNNTALFVFDLTSPEIYVKTDSTTTSSNPSRTPSYLSEWQEQFGVPAEDHEKSVQISHFNGYTVFGVQRPTVKKPDCQVENDTSSKESDESSDMNVAQS